MFSIWCRGLSPAESLTFIDVPIHNTKKFALLRIEEVSAIHNRTVGVASFLAKQEISFFLYHVENSRQGRSSKTSISKHQLIFSKNLFFEYQSPGLTTTYNMYPLGRIVIFIYAFKAEIMDDSVIFDEKTSISFHDLAISS